MLPASMHGARAGDPAAAWRGTGDGRPEQGPVLTVDYDRLGCAARRPAARPRVRLRPPRLRGRPPGRRGGGPRRRRRRGGRGAGHLRGHGRRRRAAMRPPPGPARCRATPCASPSPTAPSTGSSPPRCSSTSPTTRRPWPSWPGCCGPAAPWPSPCRAAGPRSSTGSSPTSTTTCPGATSASTGARRCGRRLPATGLRPVGSHHAHGLHSPYWWLRCLVGPTNDANPAVAAYHRLLVWDIVEGPAHHPAGRPGAQPADRQEPGRLPAQARTAGGRERPAGGRTAAWPPATGDRRWRREHRPARSVAIPEVPGVLSAAEVLATADSIAEVQRPDGMIPWFDGGHCDPWNHVEAAMALTVCGLDAEAERAYEWLADSQLPDGSWFNYYLAERGEGPPPRHQRVRLRGHRALAPLPGHRRARPAAPAVADDRAGHRLRAALAAAGRLGALVGRPRRPARGLRPAHRVVVDLPRLRCGVAVAERLGKERPDWELAAGRLGHAVAHHPGAFAPKDEFAMDWYYPVLSGALEGAPGGGTDGRALGHLRDGGARRALRVDRRLGDRGRDGRVRDGPRRAGPGRRRPATCSPPPRGSGCPTARTGPGMVYPEEVTFPGGERTTYTAAAIVLAADALSSTSPAAGLFRGEGLPAGLDLAEPQLRRGRRRRLHGRRLTDAPATRAAPPGAAPAGCRTRRPRPTRRTPARRTTARRAGARRRPGRGRRRGWPASRPRPRGGTSPRKSAQAGSVAVAAVDEAEGRAASASRRRWSASRRPGPPRAPRARRRRRCAASAGGCRCRPSAGSTRSASWCSHPAWFSSEPWWWSTLKSTAPVASAAAPR